MCVTEAGGPVRHCLVAEMSYYPEAVDNHARQADYVRNEDIACQQRLPDDGREAVSQVPAADDAVACVLKAVMMRLQEINRSTSGTSPELFFLRIEIVITYIYC
ncbi:hypothetical protein P2G42_00185 [Klebsiella electrica]|uniref:hypothetical protein n=2 Tax=Klebsiella electrica TaxID=1259973 RepID=UPI002554EA1E|nr:hypothetical protein [Klebsiella electrica]WIO43153.1 hypothetical protein P2G42_00185 [Klebsiella electrica]